MDHQLAHDAGEPSHDGGRQGSRFQGREERRHTEADIGPHQPDPVFRRQDGQRLGQTLPCAVRGPGMTRSSGDPQQASALT